MKSILSANDISNGKNNDYFVQTDDENQLFQNQQMLLEICMHTCDVSIPSRDFHVVKKWTYLLFEEFFAQGDLEKEKGLPVSMLCDRNTTHVAKS